MKKFLLGFKYAFCGVLYTIINERNMRVHIVAAITVFFFAAVFGLQPSQWAILLLTVSAVFSLEMVNTAVERVCNFCTKEKHPLVKAAKDTAAGAVLVAAIGAVFVAVCLFWQPLKWQWLFGAILEQPLYIIGLILYAVLAVIFIAKCGAKQKTF